MPVRVKQIGNKHRLVEADGSISLTKSGKPKDGGGHTLGSKAEKQAGIINAAIAKRDAKD